MTPLLTHGLVGVLALGAAATAQLPTGTLSVHTETASADAVAITAQVFEAQGTAFALRLSVGGDGFDLQKSWLVGYGSLDAEGDGKFAVPVPESLLETIDFPVHFAALYKSSQGIKLIEPDVNLPLGPEPEDDCLRLTFNHTLGDDAVMVAGRIISDQWAGIGLNISAANNNGPNKAILFDSANPTGGDDDLATPGTGVNNDTALGNLLIIAENDGDSLPVDGLIDDPDDEKDGGSIDFAFDEPTVICGLTLIDIDEEPGSEIRLYTDGDLVTPSTVIPAITLGDGSVMEYAFAPTEVDRLEVYFAGSGAIGSLDLEPCPRIIDFDEDSVGFPRALVAGEVLSNQFASLGIAISAENDVAGHPDKAILFDTGNPTGEDDDLMTPNPMAPGNTEALGLVVIIAEDDVDVAPADGLVDDPDDEGGGGEITFTFASDVTFLSTKLLDVDADEIDELRLFDKNDQLIDSYKILNLPDGSVQTIEPMESGVRRAVFDLAGSGAVTGLRFCPDPVDDDGGQGN